MSVPERIETDVVVLRRRRDADSPTMVDMIAGSLDHLAPWMAWLADGFDPDATYANGVEAERSWVDGTMFQYLLEADGSPVGTVALHLAGGGAAEIGYWLVAGAEGHGYVRSAVAELLAIAFDRLGLARIEIWHDEANVRSAGVPDALGFRVRERFTHPREPRFGNEVGVDVVHELTAAEWAQR
jgi:ribosomal-protein-serine acetyltransferase